MSLLLLSNQELRGEISAELASNPALELLDERICPNCQRKLTTRGPCPICSQRLSDEDPIVFLSPRESARRTFASPPSNDLPIQEPAAPEDLSIYALRQMASDLLEDDRTLAAYILASLDDDGFIQDPPAFIARSTGSSISAVRRVLEILARVDPPGLGSEGPQQALLTQLTLLDANGQNSVVDLCKRIIEETFSQLGRGEYEKIADRLDTTSSKVKQAETYIQNNLNPYPARAYWGSGRQPASGDPNVYYSPDIMITRNPTDPDGPLMVEIFSASRGWLRVNPLFKKLIAQKNGDSSEEWSEHLERASLFVKCLQQRNNTMRLLMETLVKKQREFILHGALYLNAMTRAEIADIVGVHESTISRAVSNKTVALPDGRIIPLSKFFDRSLPIRARVRQIVENEQEPLTDQQIASHLKKEGIRIARRTVAKYRAIENILPARLRQTKAAVA
jgi:RNA polymerase sigma-54 factor